MKTNLFTKIIHAARAIPSLANALKGLEAITSARFNPVTTDPFATPTVTATQNPTSDANTTHINSFASDDNYNDHIIAVEFEENQDK